MAVAELNSLLHLPGVSINGLSYWVDLERISENPLKFKLVDFGLE